MKNIGVSLLCGVFLTISCVVGDDVLCWRNSENFKVCSLNGFLKSVEVVDENIHILTLHIKNESLIGITDNAFEDLEIETLILEIAPKTDSRFSSSDTFGGLPKLKKLVLLTGTIEFNKYNFFNKIENVESLTVNTTISIVRYLPALKNLKHLKLMSMYTSLFCMRDYPKNIPHISHLEYENGRLGEVQSNSFDCLDNLKNLSLISMKITTIESMAFNNLKKLKYLSMKSNKLTTINKNDFAGLNNLWELYLNHNDISTIEAEAFSGLFLGRLGLSHNKLTSLENGIFDGLEVRYLDISSNKIARVAPNLFQGHKNLIALYAFNNTISPVQSWGLDPKTVFDYQCVKHLPDLICENQ